MANSKVNPLETSLQPGETLGHYRIGALVARSDTATVYRATDLRDALEVAVKAPHAFVESDPSLADWFRREREIGERLHHPGIITVIPDPDRAEAYEVMEWFDGKLLRQILDEEKRLTPERAVRIAIAICNALEYAHAQGVVLRGLRSESVMIGAEDQIKIIDFSGAAKAAARRLTFTKLAQITGGSDYISPEELKGKQVNARSDIYSLGAILYEMLTGRVPFSRSDPYDRLLNYPVPPREIDPSISPQLQEVIYRALEREPRNRYASAREFAWDLEHLDQVGVAERPELRDWEKRRSWRRRKVLLYVAVALIPIVIFGLLVFFARH